MVSIRFLGSCREVGRSGILVESNSGAKCMLDYGIRFRGKERLPQEADLTNLKAIALTHSHIDHSGAIPYLYKTFKVPLFTNPLTLRIIDTLIKDMIRISNFPYPFGYRELEKLNQNSRMLKNNFRQKIADNFYITYFDAGHIPGSVSILVEVDDKKILYTGDINNQEMNLINSANSSEIPEIDTLITESTYALRNHPVRTEVEKSFVEKIINITDSGGKVLIPAFGVARSQEALLILEKYNYKGKIFIDGLARKISNLLLNHPECLKDFDHYQKTLKKVHFISKKEGRKIAKDSNGVIIAPSGMLKGGASMGFIKTFLQDSAAAIYLIGYQVEGSPGRSLLENGVITLKERNRKDGFYSSTIKAKCDYGYFDFSSHADGAHLNQYIDNLKFRSDLKQVFCVHGDTESTTTLASTLVKKSYTSVAPEGGEVYKI